MTVSWTGFEREKKLPDESVKFLIEKLRDSDVWSWLFSRVREMKSFEVQLVWLKHWVMLLDAIMDDEIV